MLFITGLFTSIHCISMCGAINLMTIVDDKLVKNYKKAIFYNLGRVISYTLLGGIVGLIGKIISFNQTINGIMIIVVAILMLCFSLSLLGIIKIKFSLFNKFKIKNNSKNYFVVGLLNGFMPCGPLQAMQLYALSTSSFVKGALAMLLFALGTVPLMLATSSVFNLIKGKGRIIINKIASILVLILSILMLNRGLLILNIDVFKYFNNYDNYMAAKIIDDYQVIEFDLSYNNYEDIIIQKGIPVKMIIHVDKKYLTGCNEEIIFNDFDIKKKLEVGDNIIEFVPNEEGIYTYTCWMNMIKNNIKVIDNINYFEVIN